MVYAVCLTVTEALFRFYERRQRRLETVYATDQTSTTSHQWDGTKISPTQLDWVPGLMITMMMTLSWRSSGSSDYSRQARNQTYPKGGSYSSPFPFPLSLPPLPSFSLPIPSPPIPYPPLPSPHFPLEAGPLNPARGSGEHCKLPQRGLGRSPSQNRIWCILALKSDIS